MVIMANAPLRYTLAMMRFPKILSIDRYAGAFQDRVRADYPLVSEYSNQGMEFSAGPNGAELKPVTEKLWQFAELDRGHALILGSEFLVLHAGTAYGGHADFIQRFLKASEAFLRLEGVSPLMTALGYRYVDLVTPRVDDPNGLADYLEPWVMPSNPLSLGEGITLVDSVYVAGFRTPVGVLRFQALRCPPTTLPPDLDSPFVRENNWIAPRPGGEFALLDIDHAATFVTPLAIDSGIIEEHLLALRKSAAALFEKTHTAHAVTRWN